MTRGLLLLGILIMAAVPLAHADDQTILGKTLIVKDRGAAAKRKITIKAKESASDNTLVGDPGAPRRGSSTGMRRARTVR